MQKFQSADEDDDEDSNLEEERRIAFVGITRAKRFVQISRYTTVYHYKYGTQVEIRPSEFIQQTLRMKPQPLNRLLL